MSAPRLHELQQALIADTYHGTKHSAAFVPSTYQHRLAIYHHNTLLGLQAVLEMNYPVVAQLVGADFFRQLANTYARQHPLTSGDRHQFGMGFPAFVRKHSVHAQLPYLADVAHIEWARWQASLANDAPSMSLDDIAACMPSIMTHADEDTTTDMPKIGLHPAYCLVRTAFNAYDIWLAHQERGSSLATIALRETPQTLLIGRRSDGATSSITFSYPIFVLSPALCAFVEGVLQHGQLLLALSTMLQAAHDTLAETQAEFAAIVASGALILLPSNH